MKKIISVLTSEVFLYLVFGVATTLVYMATRFSLFPLIQHTLTVVIAANSVAILFAFVTNDRIVFQQPLAGWPARLIKFIAARLGTMALDTLLALLLVDWYPQLIGQFVHHDRKLINAIATVFAQVLVIVLNYVLSKLFIFKNKPSD